jgi:hypothetical protein
VALGGCAAPRVPPSPAVTPRPPGPTDGSDTAAQATPGPSLIDTSGWLAVSMQALGFQIELPSDFEVVGDDPSAPVVDFNAIAQYDPGVASGLQTQAQRIADSAGVFADLGLWAIEPESLVQVGVLAGSPYRVSSTADLRSIVEGAVAQRATPLEGSSIDGIELPAGVGFLAGYRDQTDLGAHLEVHLMTPTGRYLVLVMSLQSATLDDANESRFLAIAGSLAPLVGTASGDVPPPPSTPPYHAAADLEALLPESVGGVALERRSLNGEDLVGGSVGSAGTILDAVGSLVPTPGRVSVALAVPAEGSADLLIAAYRLDGVSSDAIQARLGLFPSQVWSHQTVGGHEALVSVVGSDGSQTWLLVAGNVLEEIDSSDATLAEEAISALP